MKFKGVIVKGKGRGAKMGFPTINVRCAIPGIAQVPDGIYAALVKVGKRVLPGVGFLGAAKTFGETEKRVEAHIFDFKKPLSGKKVEILFLKRLRANKKFKTVRDLALQMRKDEILTRKFFSYVHRDSGKNRRG